MKSSSNKMNSMVGILTILVILWAMFYALPELFATLFNTIIGNLILLVTVIIIGYKDVFMAICLIIVLLFVYRFSHYVVKEGLEKKCNPNDHGCPSS